MGKPWENQTAPGRQEVSFPPTAFRSLPEVLPPKGDQTASKAVLRELKPDAFSQATSFPVNGSVAC